MTRSVSLQVGERIRFLRLHAKGGKLTQERLAERADISVSFLSMIERGERSAHMETLAHLAQALGVPIWELFRERGRPSAGNAKSVDPIVEPLLKFIERHRLSRRDVDRLLDVATALFGN